MTVVVDASAALKWVLDEGDQAEADRLRFENLVVPEIWLAECANALWARVLRQEVTPAAADEMLAFLTNIGVDIRPHRLDIAAALSIAVELKHPIYDCIYLACAIRERGVLVTADLRFLKALSGTRYETWARSLRG